MLIQALESITVKLPQGVRTLEPGKKYDLSTKQVERLLALAPERVRVIKPNWLAAWRELAEITNGIEKSDRRFHSICDGLDQCDQCFEQDDFPAFQQAASQVKKIFTN